MAEIREGYYWARHSDGTTFIVLFEDGMWFTVGLEHPIEFDPRQIVCEAKAPRH